MKSLLRLYAEIIQIRKLINPDDFSNVKNYLNTHFKIINQYNILNTNMGCVKKYLYIIYQ